MRCEEAVECDMGRGWSWTQEEVHHPPEEGPARTHFLAGVANKRLSLAESADFPISPAIQGCQQSTATSQCASYTPRGLVVHAIRDVDMWQGDGEGGKGGGGPLYSLFGHL